MKAAIYLRKSRAEAGDEDALSRHRETLLSFAAANQIAVEEIYEEIVSGENLYLRPQMLRLLEDIGQKQYEAVLCMDIDRLGRGDMASQGVILDTLRTAGCLIVTPRRVYDLNNEMDETYSEFEAFMARQEYKMITRRMRRGVMAAAKEGSHISEVPFGYQRAWQGKRAGLAPHPEQAPWVQRAFDLYVNQFQGCQAIADLFNRQGPPPKRAQQWGRSAIRRMLRNPIYTGQWIYNRTQWQKRRSLTDKNIALPRPQQDWIVVEDAFPPLVDRQTFDQAQQIFASRGHSPYFTGEFKNPLAGLVYCGKCGKKMQRQHQQSKGLAPCLRCPTAGCAKSIRLDLVEQALLESLAETVARLRSGQSQSEEAPPEQPDLISGLEKELQALQRQQNRLYDLLEQQVYTIDLFQARTQQLAQRRQTLESRLNAARRRQNQADFSRQLLQRLDHVLECYGATEDVNEKNALLKTVVKRADCYRPKDASARQFTLSLSLLEF